MKFDAGAGGLGIRKKLNHRHFKEAFFGSAFGAEGLEYGAYLIMR